MKLNNKGSIGGMLVAGISVVALFATVIGITQNNVLNSSQAALNSTGVMLQEDTLSVRRLDDNHVEVSGQICYSRHLQSGGKEEWTLWATDNRGKDLDGENDGSHIDGGRLYVAGNGSFPATCEYTDRAAGVGKMLDKNTKQPHRFSIIATTSRRLSGSYCPEIYLNYRGTWFSGTPFAKISLNEHEDVCGPQVTPTPTIDPTSPTSSVPDPSETPELSVTPGPSTTPEPTTPVVTPTFTPTPTPDNTISGRISVYGCKQPSKATVEFCTGETCDVTVGGKSLLSVAGPTGHGIWLDDTNDDGTWIYQYRISVDENDNPLDPSKTYFLPRALGYFDNDTVFFDSEREQGEKLRVKPGTQRDFKVYANRTCGCTFNTVAYIKDTQGNIITELDNKKGEYGTANNKQIYDNGDKPAQSTPFNNLGSNPGRIDFHLTDLGDFRDARTWGRDALAAVKLYADGWRVVKQECTSKNPSAPGCPGYTDTWSETDMTKLRDPKLFEKLRVACNVNLEYGWIIEKIPPTPTAAPPAPIGGAPIGAVSCGLRDDNNTAAAQNEGCKPQNFRIKEIKEGTANLEWDVAANCPAFKRGDDRYWIIVKKQGTDQIVASRRGMQDEDTGVGADDHNPGVPPHQVRVQPEFEEDDDGDKEYYYFEGQGYTAYLYSFLDNDASCMSNPVSLNFTGVKNENSEEEPGTEEPEEPPAGGVCPQWCASASYCRQQGWEPKGPPSDQPCSVATDQWCCPPGTELPGSEGSNPGQPGNPGGGGSGSCPANSFGIPGRIGDPYSSTSPESDAGVCSSDYPPNSRPVSAPGGFCCKYPDTGVPGGPGAGNGLGTCDPAKKEFGVDGRPPAFASKSSAEKQCTEIGGNCNAIESSSGTGYCSKQTITVDNGLGTCDLAKKEYGIGGQPPAFASMSSAQKQCTEMGVDCRVIQSSTGKGYCSKRVITVNKCEGDYFGFNKGTNPIHLPGYPGDATFRQKCIGDGGTGDYIAEKTPSDTKLCCKKAPTPPPSDDKEYTYTVRYVILFDTFASQRFEIEFLPKICYPYPGGERCTSYPGIGTYRNLNLLFTGSDVKYEKLKTNNYTIKCVYKLANGQEKNCKDIKITIPKDAKENQICQYVFIVDSNGIKSHSATRTCGGGTAAAQVETETLDMNDDGTINTIDLQYLYDDYGAEGASTSDVNSDGTVNALDLSTFMNSFGTEL